MHIFVKMTCCMWHMQIMLLCTLHTEGGVHADAFKPYVQELMETWDYGFANNFDYLIEIAIAKVKAALHSEHEEQLHVLEGLRLKVHPQSAKSVIARKQFKKSELMLAPVGSVGCTRPNSKELPPTALPLGNVIVHASLSCPVQIYVNTAKFEHALPHKQPPRTSGHVNTKEPVQFLVPFWMVVASTNDNECNLEVFYKTVDCDGFEIKIPMLRNPSTISAGTVLVRPKKWPLAAAPPSTAAKRTSTKDPAAEAAGPKKKARTKAKPAR